MLLVIDVGNTNIVLGIYDGITLQHSWRITTDKRRTVDEYAVLVRDLFALAEIGFTDVKDVVISCVVPPLMATLERLCTDYFQLKALVVGSGIKTGMPILYDNPQEVGADRIVNAVAAYEKHRCCLIVIDFGTATTFDFITAQGEYLGGAIAPGIGISAEALFEKASKLPRVEFVAPPTVIARNTVNSMQAGLIYGYAGLVDGIVSRMQQESNDEALVVATGGLASLIAPISRTINQVDANLTLAGLLLLHQRNAGAL
ncbi:MAG: type III pantothenate kinase [Desulfuromonadales bacterium]|nr:type III pantothenate kinase [Desulfuromonadales bacterium]